MTAVDWLNNFSFNVINILTIMPAIRPVRPLTVSSTPVSHRPQRRTQRPRTLAKNRIFTLETTIKLGVNLILSGFAVSALIEILPQYRASYEKLQDIEAEVKLTEQRVTKEQEEFSRYFDPKQTKSIMEEQGNRVDPTQKPIIWVEPLTAEESEPLDESTRYADIQ